MSNASADRQNVVVVYPFYAHYRQAILQELLYHSPHFYVLYGDQIYPDDTIKLATLPGPDRFVRTRCFHGRDTMWQTGLMRLALRRDIHTIIYLGNAAWPATWLSAALARAMGKRVLFWTHGWTRREYGWKASARRTFYRLGHGLLLYGHTAKMLGIEQGFPPERLHVIYNSLDYESQKKARESVTEATLRRIRDQLFEDSKRPLAICTTRLTRIRRLDLLLEAMSHLKARGREVNLLLVGDGPEREPLKRMAAERGLAVRFYGACYDGAKLAELTMAANVTVAPGKVGLTAMHSLAFGTPVITHDDWEDQMPEWEAIIPGRTGGFFRSNDTQDLARAIDEWTANEFPDQRTRDACHQVLDRFYNPHFQRVAIDRAVSGLPADDLFWKRKPKPAQLRPVVAYISNGFTPYGLHFVRRVAREMPSIDLRSLYTHQFSMGQWALKDEPSLPITQFGVGEWAADANRPARLAYEWRKAGRIIRHLRQIGASAVMMLGYADIGRLRIANWCHRHKIPCFIWGDSNIRGDTAAGLESAAKRTILGVLLPRTAGVMPCGSLGKAYFRRYGVPEDRMFLVPNEPDYTLIETIDPAMVEQTAARFGINRSRHRIIFSGRLARIKRVDLLINAFAQIADERPDWDLIIAGDGPLRGELASTVPGQFRDRVIWLGFLSDQREMAAVYRLSDVLVLPSDNEPWALVVNEAAAAGLAIVASDVVGAAAELVRDGVNGYVFPHGDLAALTQSLRKVTEPQHLDAMKAGSAQVLAEWRRVADPVQGLRDALRFAGVIG